MDGRHQFRDPQTGQPVAHLTTIAVSDRGNWTVSPDQRLFAFLGKNKSGKGTSIEVFDISSQDRIALIPYTKSSYGPIRFAPDNNLLLVGTRDSIEVADIKQQRFVGTNSLGWSPSPKEKQNYGSGIAGSVVGAAYDSFTSGAKSNENRSPTPLLETYAVSSKNLIAVSDPKGNVSLWGIGSRKPVFSIRAASTKKYDRCWNMGFSPDGKWLAYYVNGVLHIIDVSGIQVPTGELDVGTTTTNKSPKKRKEATGPLGWIGQGHSPEPRFSIQIGVEAEVFSRGKWFPAKVVGKKSGLWVIQYDDSPPEWNETVSARRIRER